MAREVKQKRRDGLKRQSEIMSIALELFSSRGFHATSIDDIIRQAGVAKGTFYLHFKGKNDILEMIINHYLDMLYSSIKILDISMNKPVEEIKNLYFEISEKFISLPEIKRFVRLMLRDAISQDQSIQQKVMNFFKQIIELSTVYIKKAQEDGRVFRSIDPEVNSICIVGSVKELLYHWAVLEDDFNISNAIATTVEIYFRGMIVE